MARHVTTSEKGDEPAKSECPTKRRHPEVDVPGTNLVRVPFRPSDLQRRYKRRDGTVTDLGRYTEYTKNNAKDVTHNSGSSAVPTGGR